MIFSMITCTVCEKESYEEHGASDCPPDVCTKCRDKHESEDKYQHLDDLKQWPLEERIARIEKILYEMEKHPVDNFDPRLDLMGG